MEPPSSPGDGPVEVDFTVENLESVSGRCSDLLPEVEGHLETSVKKPGKKKFTGEVEKVEHHSRTMRLGPPNVRAQMIEADLLVTEHQL